jgi:hypothetical protein
MIKNGYNKFKLLQWNYKYNFNHRKSATQNSKKNQKFNLADRNSIFSLKFIIKHKIKKLYKIIQEHSKNH